MIGIDTAKIVTERERARLAAELRASMATEDERLRS
jgi:hypothetical protein